MDTFALSRVVSQQGCSSIGGALTENGPFDVSAAGTLSLKEFRWTRYTNMLWFENPQGVGFSYSISSNYSGGAINDFASAENNMLAIKDFFKNKMSERRGNELALAGESYAGVYVPMLAKRILEEQDAGRWANLPPL